MKRLGLVLTATLLSACASQTPAPCAPGLLPPALCERLAAADVAAVGESHDRREHHEAERDALACMACGGKPLLLGMEMFQRPFQQPLDDYVMGRIDEKEMLRRTEWFTHWGADWTMYAPLWRAAREHGARIVALNCDLAISKKVGKEGLAALTPEERAGLAQDIDLGVASHHERICSVFTGGAHSSPGEKIERLYQAQTAWDETMAESAARALAEAGPGARMLVVAGSYHVQQFDGIPDRIARRRPGTTRPLVIVLREPEQKDDLPNERIADFVVPVRPAAERVAPKLGISPGAASERGLTIGAVTKGGAAEKAGLLAGDVITAMGTALSSWPEPVRDFTDLRYFLDPLEPGQGIVVEYLRGGDAHKAMFTLAAPAPQP